MLNERRSCCVDARAASALDRVLSTRFDATGGKVRGEDIDFTANGVAYHARLNGKSLELK